MSAPQIYYSGLLLLLGILLFLRCINHYFTTSRKCRQVTYQYNTVPSNTVHRTGTMFRYYKAQRTSVDSSIDTTIIVIYIVGIHMGEPCSVGG